MKFSEFFEAVDAVYGSALGRSYVADLYIPSIEGTCAQALERGIAPQKVWHALVEETGVDERAKWFHRLDAKGRRNLR